jgi:probable F420-dependent oxidoreductase
MTAMDLGPFGFTIDPDPRGEHLATAGEIERLGFSTLWISGGKLDALDRLAEVIDVTERALVGSAIITPQVYDADEVTAFYHRVEAAAPGRLLVGLGSPHSRRPLADLSDYLDRLDEADHPVPVERRVLAALGPRALDVARDRFAGAMPALLTPAYVTSARERLGPDRILSVGLYVVLDRDPTVARTTARQPLTFLCTLPAYVKSLRRQGFSEEDVNELSDRLVDGLIVWGSSDDIAQRAWELHDAGADHIHLTVLHAGDQPAGLPAARLLAPALGIAEQPSY